MAEEVSQAAQDYGRAFCVDPAREWLPLDQLTTDEAACVMRVGRSFEAKIDQSLGAIPPVAVATAFPVQTAGGKRVASLSMAPDGTVLVCTDTACAPVGEGVAAAIAAEQVLGLMGLQVGGNS